jgi:formylglycine-generating enzyme required for sulfatase activity
MVYGGVQVQNRVAVHRRVEQRMAEASVVMDKARALMRVSVTDRERAFALYRSARVIEAEKAWAEAIAAGAEADLQRVEAARLFEVALAQDPGRDDVRTHLGEVLYERALVAERDKRWAQQDELLQRLRLYDPFETWQRALATPMTLDIKTRPAGAAVRVARYVEKDGVRELVEPRTLGLTPLAGVELQNGSVLLELEAPGRAPVRYPLLAERATRLELSIDLPASGEVPAGYAYIPPGRFQFGSAADEEVRRGFLAAPPIHDRETEGYFIALHEVTYTEWTAYLDTLSEAERLQRSPSIEAHVSGKSGLELRRGPDQVWVLKHRRGGRDYEARWGEPMHYPKRTRGADQDWRRMPVTAVSAPDAEAYTAWLHRTGRMRGARLCTELEWERAARGADSRVYPSGSRLDPNDANFDETYGKDQIAMGPDEVGSHPRSTSPFGLADMAGNAFEWTTSALARGGYVARGGSYFYDIKTAQVVNRTESIPTLRDASVGFRVCAPHVVGQ